jgi:molybdenum cofactor biosynthesis enzyme MoaA
MKKKLSDYICPRPFETLHIMETHFNSCCPDWNTLRPSRDEYEIENIWNSELYKNFRVSILDGSYRYCQDCPFVQMISETGDDIEELFLLKSKLPDSFNGSLESISPKELNFSIDTTCNYKCPSCRSHMIVGNGEKNKTVVKTINDLENAFSNYIESIITSGACDPFASPPIRNFLKNFDPSKYKKLKSIEIVTNGSLFTKEMWNSMTNIHTYVDKCSISIDAGTKYTYENLVRINGNWDKLLNNLKYINSIETIKNIRTFYVVQKCNYKEMEEYVNIMKEIFGDRARISFTNMTNWGSFTPEEFINRNVSDSNHPEFEQLKIESIKVLKYKNVDFFKSLYTKIFNPNL